MKRTPLAAGLLTAAFALGSAVPAAAHETSGEQAPAAGSVRMWEDPGYNGELYVDYSPGQAPDDEVEIDWWDGDDEISSIRNSTNRYVILYDYDVHRGDKMCISPGDSISNLERIGFDNRVESFKLRRTNHCDD